MAYDFSSTGAPGEQEEVYSITELARLIKEMLVAMP